MEVKLQVSLPAAHPLLAAARQGYLDGHTAVAATFGWVSALKNPSMRVTGTTAQGILTIDSGGWSPEFSLRSGYGLGAVPFLSARDELTVTLPSTGRSWFDARPPVELTTEKAVWRGPLPVADAPGPIIRLGVEGAGLAPATPEEADRQAEGAPERETPQRLREFLVGFEARHIAPYVAWPLWALKSLIPFAGLLWLSRRAPFDGAAAWRPFVAALLVLSVWRSWPFLSWLADAGLSQWLWRAASYAVLGLKDVEYTGNPRFDAFWLLFLTFVALAPAYFRAVEFGGLSWDHAQPRRSRVRWFRAAWTGVRLALGGTALLVLVVMVRPDCRLRSNPLSAVVDHLVPVLGQPGLPAVLVAVVSSMFLLACGLRPCSSASAS